MCVSGVWEVVRWPLRATFEPFRAKMRVLGRSEPQLPGRVSVIGKSPQQEPRRMEKTGKKDRKWLGIWNLGSQLGNVSGQTPETPRGWRQEEGRHGVKES